MPGIFLGLIVSELHEVVDHMILKVSGRGSAHLDLQVWVRACAPPTLHLELASEWPWHDSCVLETLRVDPKSFLSCLPAARISGEMVGNSRSCDLGLYLGADFCIEANGSQ